tara:strand:- start:1605 stop:1706 length:102 start_codon:yes stop_codon:yes gene_type:complete
MYKNFIDIIFYFATYNIFDSIELTKEKGENNEN